MQTLITIFMLIFLSTSAHAFGGKSQDDSTKTTQKALIPMQLDAARFPWELRVLTSTLSDPVPVPVATPSPAATSSVDTPAQAPAPTPTQTSVPLHIMANKAVVSVGPCIEVDTLGVQLDPQKCLNILGADAEKRLEKIRLEEGKIFFRANAEDPEIYLGTFSLEDSKKKVDDNNANVFHLPVHLAETLRAQIEVPSMTECKGIASSPFASKNLSYKFSLTTSATSKADFVISRAIVFSDYSLCDTWLHTWPPVNYKCYTVGNNCAR